VTVPREQSPALATLPGVSHGFFGRRGGVSASDFASLNMSATLGDDPALVARNRGLAVTSLGFPDDSLALVKQVHSATVLTIASPETAAARPAADGMVTALPGVVLGILTADCAPVLLADPEAKVIGAFHAGWKGAIGGIAAETVRAMTALGADPARIAAAIGPTISQANYEVGPDFTAELLRQHPDAGRRISLPGGREHFDLPGFVADLLREAGIGRIDDLALCTYAAPDQYFSHRYATHRGTTTGRQIALIGLS
jgi:YfiH family protein